MIEALSLVVALCAQSPAVAYFTELRAIERDSATLPPAELAKRLDALAEKCPDDVRITLDAGLAWGRAGELDKAIERVAAADRRGAGLDNRNAYTLAQLNARAGRPKAAMDWLERCLAAGYGSRPGIATDAAFSSLRDEPRFRTLSGQAPDGLDRVSGWRYDVDFLAAEAKRMHADPRRPADSAEFAAAVAALKQRVPDLDDTEFFFGLQELLVMLGDGHTGMRMPGPLKSGALPITLYVFSDGVFVIDGSGDGEELIGAEIVAFAGEPTPKVIAALRRIVSRDNDQQVNWVGPRYLVSPAALRCVGIGDRDDRITLRVRIGDEEVDVVLRAERQSRGSKLVPPADSDAPRWLRRVGDNYWLEPIEDIDAVYAQFNQVRDAMHEPIAAFASRLRDEIESAQAKNLILDFRHNNGGNNFLSWPLIRVAAWHATDADDHRVFVISGRNTFSACQNTLNRLEPLVDPIVVGEPSSSRPNFPGESTQVVLPYTGWQLGISNRYWQDSYPWDERPWIAPDVPVRLSSADYFDGHDPALAAIAEIIRG